MIQVQGDGYVSHLSLSVHNTVYACIEIIFRVMVWIGNVPHRLRYWKPWSPSDDAVSQGYGACRTWSLPIGQYITAGGVWEFIASPHFYLTLLTSRFLLKTNSQVPAAIPPCQKDHRTNKKYHRVPMKQTRRKNAQLFAVSHFSASPEWKRTFLSGWADGSWW